MNWQHADTAPTEASLCQVENSQVEDNMQYDDKVVTTIDVHIQTPRLKRSSPFIPFAPKR